jgi:hypothetical protein
MDIQLLRQYHFNGTNGELLLNGIKIADTIELPWRDNQNRISCIPEGKYRIRPRYTQKFLRHCLVQDVPGREGILIHTFNDALKESKGCIALVSTVRGWGKGDASRLALNKLLDVTMAAFEKHEPVYLIIKKSDHEIDNAKGCEANTKVLSKT